MSKHGVTPVRNEIHAMREVINANATIKVKLMNKLPPKKENKQIKKIK